MMEDLVRKNRSVRRFVESKIICNDTLSQLVDLARLSPSAANLQPLKYIISGDKTKNAEIFPCLKWAGHLDDWNGPCEGERPSAYIIILSDRSIVQNPGCDQGIAAQSILLGALEKGLSGCIIGSIYTDKLRINLEIPDKFEILLVIALGRSAEKVEIEEVEKANIKYWRDENAVHHVPKRSLKDIIFKAY